MKFSISRRSIFYVTVFLLIVTSHVYNYNLDKAIMVFETETTISKNTFNGTNAKCSNDMRELELFYYINTEDNFKRVKKFIESEFSGHVESELHTNGYLIKSGCILNSREEILDDKITFNIEIPDIYPHQKNSNVKLTLIENKNANADDIRHCINTVKNNCNRVENLPQEGSANIENNNQNEQIPQTSPQSQPGMMQSGNTQLAQQQANAQQNNQQSNAPQNQQQANAQQNNQQPNAPQNQQQQANAQQNNQQQANAQQNNQQQANAQQNNQQSNAPQNQQQLANAQQNNQQPNAPQNQQQANAQQNNQQQEINPPVNSEQEGQSASERMNSKKKFTMKNRVKLSPEIYSTNFNSRKNKDKRNEIVDESIALKEYVNKNENIFPIEYQKKDNKETQKNKVE